MAIEAFGEALAWGFWFVLMFGLLLLACLVATAVIVVLYGLRVATYATVLGILIAVPSGIVVGTTTGSFGAILIAVVLAFLVGGGAGYVRWGSGSAVSLLEGTGYRVLLVIFSLIGASSGLLFWAFLMGTVGMGVWEVARAHPDGFLVLVFITLTPVAAGGYVLKRLTLDHPIRRREPA